MKKEKQLISLLRMEVVILKVMDAFLKVLKELQKMNLDRFIQEAFLELATPLIPDAITRCVSKGYETIYVIPLMLFPGRHVKEDIPRMIQDAKERYCDVDFHYSGPLSSCAPLAEWLHASLKVRKLE